MIKLKDKDNSFNLPTGWGEVTYNQWKLLQDEKDELKIVSILSGIPLEMVKRLGNKTLYRIVNIIQFVNTEMDLDSYTIPKILKVKRREINYIEDITEATFGQKIYLQQIVNDSGGDILSIIHDVVLVYSQPFIDKSNFDINRLEQLKDFFNDVFLVDLYSTAFGYITQLKDIVTSEANNLRSPPNSDQLAAGVDMFDEFGVMNTVKALAGGDILKFEEVLKIEYNIVFLHMKMNKVQNVFNENYRKVLDQKRKR